MDNLSVNQSRSLQVQLQNFCEEIRHTQNANNLTFCQEPAYCCQYNAAFTITAIHIPSVVKVYFVFRRERRLLI